MTTTPWDHNGECTFCDELGMHRADCPWLLALIAERDRLREIVAAHETELADLQVAYQRALRAPSIGDARDKE